MDAPPTPTARGRRPSGRDAKSAARTARAHAFVPYITRKIPYYEVLGEEGLALLEHNADTILEEIGIDFRDDPESLAAVEGGRRGRARRARALPARHVPHARAALGAARVHPVRAQSGAQRGDRRRPHRVCARLRLTVRAQPRRGAPLRDDRGLPQLREARLHVDGAAPLGRHHLRAGRPAGQQAALRHGLQPHEVQRQAVHGLGHPSGARAATPWR